MIGSLKIFILIWPKVFWKKLFSKNNCQILCKMSDFLILNYNSQNGFCIVYLNFETTKLEMFFSTITNLTHFSIKPQYLFWWPSNLILWHHPEITNNFINASTIFFQPLIYLMSHSPYSRRRGRQKRKDKGDKIQIIRL